jgi:hypothetical protein
VGHRRVEIWWDHSAASKTSSSSKPQIDTMKTLTVILAIFFAVVTNAATVNIAWDVNTDGVTVSYVVYKTIGTTTTVAGNTAQPTVMLTIPREAPGTTVSYYVTAKSAQGLESGPSNVVVDNVPVTLPLPTAVVNLQGTVSVSSGTVTQTLNWTANPPSEAVTQYLVRRYDANNVLVQSMTSTGTAVQMTYPQATMRTDVVAVNATGAGPVKSFTVQSPRVPWNARITVIN